MQSHRNLPLPRCCAEPYAGEVWCVFLCTAQAEQGTALVTGLRLLTDADRTALRMRRDRWTQPFAARG